MQRTESKSLTLIDFLSSNQISETRTEPEPDIVHQQIVSLIIKSVNTELALTDIGDKLLAFAEHAYTFRRMDAVESLSMLLINLPFSEQYKSAGRYYKALCIKRRGQFDEARALFDRVTEEAPIRYRINAMVAIGSICWQSGDYDSAWPIYFEALSATSNNERCDLLTKLQACRGIAVLKGIYGNNHGALEDLENMFALAHVVGSQYPALWYDYLNSLAVEMMEVGRLEEAENASSLVVASPFAKAYPEWQETKDEIAVKTGRRSGSVVAIEGETPAIEAHSPVPVLESGEAESSNEEKSLPSKAQSVSGPASILLFPARSQQAARRPASPSKITFEGLRQMTVSQKRARVLELIYHEETPEDVYDDILLAAGLVVAEEEKPEELDFDTPGALEETVRLWVNGDLDPEKFAAVISALRDCEDDLRRADIMDRMISYAFTETREAMRTEDEWRKRVEARLKPETD